MTNQFKCSTTISVLGVFVISVVVPQKIALSLIFVIFLSLIEVNSCFATSEFYVYEKFYEVLCCYYRICAKLFI